MKQLIEQTLNTIARIGNSEQVILFSISIDKKNNTIAKVIGVCTEGKLTVPAKKIVNVTNTPLKKAILAKQGLFYSSRLIKQFLPVPTIEGGSLECLCLPLLTEKKQQLKGIAILFQKTNSTLSNKCLQTLDTFSPMIAAVIEAAQKNISMKRLATNSASNCLYTRHYLEMRLREELTRIHRYGGKVSLLLVDIDNFIQVNNACGTKDSILILQEVVSLLTGLIRSRIDLLCSYNTKQFAILLPNTGIDNACILAERLRQRCEHRLFMTQQGVPIRMTLSVGIAYEVSTAYDHNSTSKDSESKISDSLNKISTEELIHRAKVMLRIAKQAGNNKIMAWW